MVSGRHLFCRWQRWLISTSGGLRVLSRLQALSLALQRRARQWRLTSSGGLFVRLPCASAWNLHRGRSLGLRSSFQLLSLFDEVQAWKRGLTGFWRLGLLCLPQGLICRLLGLLGHFLLERMATLVHDGTQNEGQVDA